MQNELLNPPDGVDLWTPLAERMRPRSLAEFVGQRHLLGVGGLLTSLLEQGAIRSLILWGPPGTGKTTLARLLGSELDAELVPLSAVSAGVKQIRETAEAAQDRARRGAGRTVLFVDEIHRFTKAQQDVLLPFVERGIVSLIGATTENPSFELTNALRSRCRVLAMHPLDREDLARLVRRALADSERGLGPDAPEITEHALDVLCREAHGDARAALGTLEVAADLARTRGGREGPGSIGPQEIADALQRRAIRYDRDGDHHYQNMSAFIKSMRGSDPDAALFYLIRMLEAGEDAKLLLRRMIIFASEDVGNADPRALEIAVAAQRAFEVVGMPEGTLAMTQAVTYLSTAPKSNAALLAYARARRAVLEHPNAPVPTHLAVSHASGAAGKASGYRYPHDFEGSYVPQCHLPDHLRGEVFYAPAGAGFEATLVDRLRTWRAGRDGADG